MGLNRFQFAITCIYEHYDSTHKNEHRSIYILMVNLISFKDIY